MVRVDGRRSARLPAPTISATPTATWLEDARIAALLSTSGVMTAGVPQADGSLRLEPQI